MTTIYSQGWKAGCEHSIFHGTNGFTEAHWLLSHQSFRRWPTWKSEEKESEGCGEESIRWRWCWRRWRLSKKKNYLFPSWSYFYYLSFLYVYLNLIPPSYYVYLFKFFENLNYQLCFLISLWVLLLFLIIRFLNELNF